MKRPPAVAVHSLVQARAALGTGLDATLLSGPGAGWYAGAAWWIAMMEAAAQGRAAPFPHVLDCADAPGAAVSALAMGQKLIVLDAGCPAFPRVAAMAGSLGAEVSPARPHCLDLGEPGAERRLAAWLGSQGDTVARLR